jgi:hypothetical protein
MLELFTRWSLMKFGFSESMLKVSGWPSILVWRFKFYGVWISCRQVVMDVSEALSSCKMSLFASGYGVTCRTIWFFLHEYRCENLKPRIFFPAARIAFNHFLKTSILYSRVWWMIQTCSEVCGSCKQNAFLCFSCLSSRRHHELKC